MFELGSIVAKFKADLNPLKAAMTEAKNLASSAGSVMSKGFQMVKNAVSDLTQQVARGAQQMAILSSIVAGLITAKLVGFFTASSEAASNFEKSMITLDIIAKRFGQSGKQAQETAKALGKELKIGTGAAAESLQNLIKSGLSIDKASDLLRRFTNEALTGKSPTISLSQAVQNLSFAYATGNSALGNLSGVSENFNDIIERGAKMMKKKTANMTEAELQQAKYLGMIALTNQTMGSAERFTGTLIDTQAQLSNQIEELQVKIGQRLNPALNQLLLAFMKSGAIEKFEKVMQGVVSVVNIFIAILTGADPAEAIGEITNELSALGMSREAIKGVTGAVVKLLTWLKDNKAEIEEFTKIFAALVAVFTSLALVLGIIASPLVVFLGTMAAIAAAVVAIKKAWETNFGGIQTFVQGLQQKLQDFVNSPAIQMFLRIMGEIMTNIITNLRNAFEQLRPKLEELGLKFMSMMEKLRPFIEVMIQIAGVVIGGLIVGFAKLVEFLSVVLGPVLEVIIGILGVIFDVIGGLAEFISTQVVPEIARELQVLATIFNWLNKNIIQPFVTTVIAIFTRLGSETARVFNWIKMNIVDPLVAAFNIAKAVFSGIQGTASTQLNNLVNTINNFKNKIIEALVAPFRAAWDFIGGIATGIRRELDKINPFHKESPSLVEYVQMGVVKIKGEYDKLTDIAVPAVAHIDPMIRKGEGGLIAGVQSIPTVQNEAPKEESDKPIIINVDNYYGDALGLRNLTEKIMDEMSLLKKANLKQ
jgi:hypothetical protein